MTVRDPPTRETGDGVTMPAAASDTRGVLSWQQVRRLRRDLAHGALVSNSAVLFALPRGLKTEHLRDRLAELVSQEDALRITEFSYADNDGYATYSPVLELPVYETTADTASELDAITARMLNRPFGHRGPLWEMAVIEHPDESGRPARSACAVFEQLICDGRSLHLFRSELTGENVGAVGQQHGRFRDWAAWQRRQFPMADTGAKTAAGQFWLRYLDGTPPDRGTMFPFFSPPAGPLGGYVQVIHDELPVSMSTLRSCAGRLRSSPFLLFLASVASAIGLVAGLDDVTLKVNTSGRPPRFLDTIGCFADNAPIRIRSGSLSDPQHALTAATSAWLETIEFQSAPWDYIRAVCGPSYSEPAAANPPQLVINFMPWTVHRRWHSKRESRQYPGASLDTFELIMMPGGDGTCYLDCQFDPERLAPAGVDDFLKVLASVLTRLTQSR